MTTPIRMPAVQALELSYNIFRSRGLSPVHARQMAQGLVDTSLLGIDTHGLRLLPLYVRELEEGRSAARPDFHSEQTAPSVIRLNAGNAPGLLGGFRAAELARDLADENGVGVVSVSHSNHFGAASLYGLEIARHDMIGIVMTSAAARVAPFGGKQLLFGTNPICFVAPGLDGRHFLLDMATSQIAYCMVKHYRKEKQPLPVGWVIDERGQFTQEPDQVFGLCPLGGYKGQGLAMMVQILCTVLAGAPRDHELSHLDTGSFSEPRQIGHFLLALKVSAFLNPDDFRQQLHDLLQTVRNSAPVDPQQPVQVAGDPQRKNRENRLQHGIPMSSGEYETLMQLADGAR